MHGGTLGPYRLDRELGAGGMGRVWAARVEGRVPGLDVGCSVALKVVHPHLLETPGFFQRFLREAEIGRAVVHGNVVRTIGCDQVIVDGRPQSFLVMEYVEGQTLRGLLAELERVPEELCRHIGREVTKGLAAIHAAGVVHRDMKPENVLITRDHAVKVMDLGVARLQDEALRLSQTGAFVGSLHYAAPECFHDGGRNVDGRADLHALGLVLYELACGVNPYFAESVPETLKKVLHETPRRLGDVNPQLSPFFEEVVHTLLAKQPAERFADANALLAALEDGEKSAWWTSRAKAIRAETKRPLRRIRIPRETAVYGRDPELAKLRALFEKAKSGDGQVVLIEGEAGIGKSRLVDELVGRLQRDREDLNFLFGSHPPGGAATGAGALSTAFREHVGDAGVAPYLPQTPLLVPAFDALLRGDATPTGAEPLTRDSIATCFVQALRALANERPTVLLVDDLHFAGEDSRAMFTSLALAAPGHAILLVGTTRPGLDEKWVAGLTRLPHTSATQVGRLGPKDLAFLLKDSFRSQRLAEQLAFQIGTKSDGNPFFAFEIVRGLREGQFITQRDDGTWVTTRVIDDIQIPSSVLDLVNARVADLTQDERDLLDVAACWGFEFDPLLVGEVVGLARIPLLKVLSQIERKHRLVRSAGQRFSFDHHQVQEALYKGLPALLRESYHAALAEALERLSGSGDGDAAVVDGALCADLCRHFLEGARGAAALRYLARAQDHLSSRWLHAQFVRLTEAALAVPGLLRGKERARVLMRLPFALKALGLPARHEECVREAGRLAEEAGDDALQRSTLNALGAVLESTGRLDQAEAVYRRTLLLAGPRGDRLAEAGAAAHLGRLLANLGRFADAREHGELAAALARELGERRMEAGATVNLGTVHLRQGRLAEARDHFERGRALCRQAEARDFETVAEGRLGEVFVKEGRLDDATASYERQLALARGTGLRGMEAVAYGNLADVCLRRGRSGEALEHTERAIELSREIGDVAEEMRATGNLGVITAFEGRFAEARDFHRRAIEIARQIGDRIWDAYGRQGLGIALHALGDRAGARSALETAVARCREMGLREVEGWSLRTLARIADDEGRDDEALRLTLESLAAARTVGELGEVAATLLLLGELRSRRGDDDARPALVEAVEIARAQNAAAAGALGDALLACLPGGSSSTAAEPSVSDDPSLAPRVRYFRWKAAGDRAELAAAKRLLDELLAKNPPECRKAMLANIRLHREIVAAFGAQGL